MKYELDQLIYYLRDNKVHGAPVLARMKVENLHSDWACTNAQKQVFTPFGEAGVFYGTCHGIIKEEDAYASKKELSSALCWGEETLERTYTTQEIAEYISGWVMGNYGEVATIGEYVLRNALSQLEDEQDGIEAVMERKEYYKQNEQQIV